MFSLDAHVVKLANQNAGGQLAERGLADNNFRAILFVDAFKPRGEIHGVADGGIFEALHRADIADHRMTGIDADADADGVLSHA